MCFIDCCLSFFFWPLCCLFFFDIQILITPLVSSNSSLNSNHILSSTKDQTNVHNSGILCINWRLSYLSLKKNNLILYSIFDHLTFGGWGIFLFVKKSLEFNRLDYHPFSTVTWCLLQKGYHCVCLSVSDTGRIQIVGSIYLFIIIFIWYIYHSWMY